MKSTTEILTRVPLWAIKLIYIDMQKFMHQIATQSNYKGKALQGNPINVRGISDPDIQLILQHLNEVTRCLLNYAYVNSINIEGLNEYDMEYSHAKATWNTINTYQIDGLNPKLTILENYSDRTNMYCLLLWICAHQVLLNKVDVYDDTIDEFFEWMVDYLGTKYKDERTQPLFKLISQLGYFHIN